MTNDQLLLFPILSYGNKNTVGAVARLFFPPTPHEAPLLAHMGLEHASREKKLPMVNFLIFVHKNVYRIRFQEIKIRPLKGFEKFAFCFFAHYKISPSKGPKYP